MLLLLPLAFFSGILTVFSPCVLPILPVVLASGLDGNTKRVNGVIAGLVISFTLASLLFATLVRVLGISADSLRVVAVVVLAVLGVALAFPAIWDAVQEVMERYWRFQPVQTGRGGFWGGFLMGASLGVVWTPCIGPIVAAVATLAAVSAVSLTAVLIVLFYALGVALPLFLIARGGTKISSKLTIFKREQTKIRQVFGVVLITTAVFFWFGADRALQAWTLDNLPESWTNLATTFESRFAVDSQLQELKNSR